MTQTRLKESLRRGRAVAAGFRDGAREDSGEAVAVSDRGLRALLKVSPFGDAPVVPAPSEKSRTALRRRGDLLSSP